MGLRKVFVSIKGYYYQAEIMGQLVTWIVPHPFAYEQPQGVDFKLMSIFVEFYTTMLGFVNFRLYHNLNLQYPPMLAGTVRTDEDMETDDAPIVQSDDDKVELDNISIGTEDPSKVEEAREEAAKVKNLQSLFKNMKFFLSREIPREPLVFMIRSFGGEVSWDNTAAPGSTYHVDDTSVTHQICDRPRDSIDMKHINRFYVQPQWIFDSINRRELLEMHKYFVGEPLPPHLSPFISEERRVGDYMPPEEKELLGLIEKSEQKEAADDEDVEEEEESDDDDDASEDGEEEDVEDEEEEEEGASDDEEKEEN